MAVNTRILAGSLAAALVISVGGGYLLSRSDSSSSKTAEIAVLGSGSVATSSPRIPTDRAVQGEKLPVVDLVDLDGNTVSTASLIGHPLVINVWATTCEACKQEMPVLAKVQQDVGDRVQFIGVNAVENTPAALQFAMDRGVHYTLMSDHSGELQGALGITGLPYTVFVAADGTIIAQKGIAIDEATIRANVAKLLP